MICSINVLKMALLRQSVALFCSRAALEGQTPWTSPNFTYRFLIYGVDKSVLISLAKL